MGKAFMWGFIGFLFGIITVELTDGKPAEKVRYDRYEIRYIYRPYSNQHFYNYGRHPDTFNNRRPSNNGGSRNSRGNSGNRGTTRTTPTVERGETHTGNVPQNDRKKN
jgi:hypothetical protein